MKPLSFLTLLRLLRTVTNGRTKTTSLLVNNSYSSLQHSGCIYNGRITNDDRISIIDSTLRRYISLSVVWKLVDPF